MTLLLLLAMPLPDGDTNVALDDERLKDDVPKGLQKVELDLDDALFLEFEEKEEEPTPAESEPEPEPETETTALVPQEKAPFSFARKKYLILGIAAALCLILGAGGAYFFLKSGSEETPAPQQTEQTPQTEHPSGEQAEAPAAHEAAEAPAMPPVLVTHTLEKFQVEYVVANQIRFLSCSLSIPGITEIMRLEMQAKSVFIRDGVYRYLKNAPLSFLDNPDNSDKLKNDLAAVINQHMKSGSVSQIMIEEYVVR